MGDGGQTYLKNLAEAVKNALSEVITDTETVQAIWDQARSTKPEFLKSAMKEALEKVTHKALFLVINDTEIFNYGPNKKDGSIPIEVKDTIKSAMKEFLQSVLDEAKSRTVDNCYKENVVDAEDYTPAILDKAVKEAQQAEEALVEQEVFIDVLAEMIGDTEKFQLNVVTDNLESAPILAKAPAAGDLKSEL